MSAAESSSDAHAADRWTVRRILEWTMAHLQKHGSESPRLDAEILLAHARCCPRVQIYTQYDHELTDAQRSTMRELVKRRADREPVAHLVGHREFFSLEFEVTKETLVPRPDTETLVVELLEIARESPQPRILEIGTGTGCIAIAAVVNLPSADITATDLSAAALQVAKRNAAKHGVSDRIDFRHGDLFEPVGVETRFEVIVSNPPYISENEHSLLQAEVARHEPKLALVSGADGLDLIRRLLAESPAHLHPGGTLLFEIAPEQAGTVVSLANESGKYAAVRVVKDLSRADRVVIATGGP